MPRWQNENWGLDLVSELCYNGTERISLFMPKPIPLCHPDKTYHAKGLCKSCYYKAWIDKHGMHSYRARSLARQAIYKALQEMQAGACAICYEKSKKLWWDHSHRTGKDRGLLCPRCNLAITKLEDNRNWASAALAYLLKYE